ncbi:GGDEF domain-containing protein [Brucepastera parasyntrophica]|uniref:GGDEF domain-containing protein n=1 Tax=Brucepastera parasyntrophica TaxID=2880008 RepID=UPI00210B8F20|nr:GGDEF domain-containing protein [Brucepastera parasyntrophica]ULQ60074.1 GGDEF domain-containing protein [Brucepastera parasyntrophica]
MKISTFEQQQDLFVQVLEELSRHSNPYEPISGILKTTCDFFGFACGFIYEADHTQTFHLRESYVRFNTSICETIQISKYLKPDEIAYITNTSAIIIHKQDAKNELEKKLLHFFHMNTILLIPIIDAEKQLIGIAGMMDRRSEVLLYEPEVNAACSVMKVVGNHIKLRVYQHKLEATKESLLSIMDHMGIDIYVNDFYTHEILYANKSMADPYGGLPNMMGKTCWQALYSDKTGECDYCPQKKLIDENGEPTKAYSWDYQRPFDKSWFRVFSASFPWVDGRLAHVVTSVDITENKRNEELIKEMAGLDTLTKLRNRRSLLYDCSEMLKRAEESGTTGYFLFFDLDNFKTVNDTLGHQTGDELLVAMAQELTENPLTQDRIYRHAGDEFVLLCEDTSSEKLQEILDYLLGRFQQPWQLSDSAPVCPLSIGVASFPKDGDTVEQLLHASDTAMYSAKRQGKSRVCYYEAQPVKSL